MEDRKRRVSPAGGATAGSAAQKRRLADSNSTSNSISTSTLEHGSSDGSGSAGASASLVDQSLGLEAGFLEVRSEREYRAGK